MLKVNVVTSQKKFLQKKHKEKQETRCRKVTRCRELIDTLPDLNISIDYDILPNIKSQLADSILTEINNNDAVFIPRSIFKDLPINVAIDNTDL